MQGPPSGVSVEALLEHRGWVRALARSLAADEASADDLEQEAWLTALRRPPARDGGLRAWLASVVRSRAADAGRSEGSRRGRERKAARPEAVPSSEDLARLAELQARVARAVVALEEPYRYAILLHYFHGLTVDGVAARTGVPRETARTRIRRALARLRDLLDADHDGDRRAWIALLGTLAGREGPSIPGGAITGGVLMTMKAKAGIAAAVVLLACWWAFRGGEEPPSAPAPEVAAAPAPLPSPLPAPSPSPPPPPPPVEPPSPPPMDPVPPSPPPEEEAAPVEPPKDPAPDESITLRYTGRVLDDHRQPVAGASVAALVEGRPFSSTTSDGEGRFELRVPRRSRRWVAWQSLDVQFRAATPDGRVGATCFGWGPATDRMLQALVVVVGPGRTLDVRVVDDRGPVPGADVVLASDRCPLARARADAAGRALLGPFPKSGFAPWGASTILVSAAAPGRGGGAATLHWLRGDEGPIVLHLSSRDLAVEVVDADTGKGIPGAEILLRMKVPASEDAGRDWYLDYLPEIEETRTDGSGRAVIRGLNASARLLVEARADGYGGDHDSFLGAEAGRPVRILLAPSRRVWWPVTDAGGPVPTHGTVVGLHRGHLARSPQDEATGWEWGPLSATEGRIEVSVSDGARLVVDGAGGGAVLGGRRTPFDGVAATPDGRLALFHWDGTGDRGPAVSFRTPRTATIEVLAGDGTPREGVEVAIIGEGSPGELQTRGYGLTDAAGRTVIGGLYGGMARVVLRDPRRENLDEHASGRVDLEEGDAFLSIRLSERTPLEFIVHTRVNGEARLPTSYLFTVWQGRETTTFWEGNIDPSMEDPATGTLRCTAWLLRPREKLGLSMNAPGFYAGMMQELPAGKREGPVEVAFDLVPPPPPPPASVAAKKKDEVPGESPEARLRRLLDTARVTFHQEGAPVADALAYLSAAGGINVVTNPSARDGVAVEGDFALEDRTLRDALGEILGKADGLDFVVRGGVVIVLRR